MAKDPKKISVCFKSDAVLKRVGGDDLVYEKGKTYSLRHDQADRWINRGLAERVSDARASAKAETRETGQTKTDSAKTDPATTRTGGSGKTEQTSAPAPSASSPSTLFSGGSLTGGGDTPGQSSQESSKDDAKTSEKS